MRPHAKLLPWSHMFVVISYLVLAIVLFLPILAHFNSAIAIRGSIGEQDGWQNVWMLWWTQHALANGQNPFYTTKLFYPSGANLFWQTLNITNGLLALPVTALVGPIAGFNTIAIASLAACGCTMYLLALRVVGSQAAAWIAGLLFMFSPIHIVKIYDGQLEKMSLQYFPLLILSLLYALDHKRQRWAWIAGLLLVWITLTSLYYGLFSIILLGIYLLIRVVARFSWRELYESAKHAAIIVLPLSALLLTQGFSTDSGNTLRDWEMRQIYHSATPLDLVLPNPQHPLWGDAIQRLQLRYGGGQGVGPVSPGLVTILLAGVALILGSQQLWRWLIALGLLLLLALGPYLTIGTIAVPLPFALVNALPFARLGQNPSLITALASVLFCLLAAFGYAYLGQRLPRHASWLLAITLLIAGIELLPLPVQRSDLNVPPFYARIPPGSGAILELPFQKNESSYLSAQTIHHRPISGGYLARIPDYDFVEHAEGIRQLWQPVEQPESILRRDWTEAIVPSMSLYHIEYVVLHLDALEPERAAYLQQVLAARLQESYRDATLVAYQRPSVPASEPLLYQTAGWEKLEADGERRWQWTAAAAELLLVRPAEQRGGIALEMQLSTLTTTQPVKLYQQQGREWRLVTTFVASPERRSYRVLITPAGRETLLRFEAQSELSSERTPRNIALSFTQLRLRPLK
jgi:hypothetical protein